MRRRHLAQTLRELREQAGMTMDEVAQALDQSRSAVGHLETSRNLPTRPVLEKLLRLYGAYEERFDQLDELRREAKKPGWWSTYRLPSWLQTYVGLEADAVAARVFALELVPGLLQTEAYARQIHAMGRLSRQEVDQRVAARLQRQQRLTGPHQLTLSAVISEGALQRLHAEPAIAAEQLGYLEESARLSSVSLHVLPYVRGLHRSMSGSFTLLEFAPGVSLPIGYQEYAIGGHLVDEQDAVRELADVYDQLRDQALGPEESLKMLSEARRRLR